MDLIQADGQVPAVMVNAFERILGRLPESSLQRIKVDADANVLPGGRRRPVSPDSRRIRPRRPVQHRFGDLVESEVIIAEQRKEVDHPHEGVGRRLYVGRIPAHPLCQPVKFLPFFTGDLLLKRGRGLKNQGKAVDITLKCPPGLGNG